MIDALKWAAIRCIDSHPMFYTGAKRLVHYLPFLLPHEKSFYGLMHFTNDGDGLFLDVGANDGISALSFRRINQTYTIFSIEPNELHLDSLNRLKKKLKHFDFKIIAAGDSPSQLQLNTPIINGVPIHSAASLDRDLLLKNLRAALPQKQFDKLKLHSQSVEVIPLDSLNLKPDIIKVDVEGFDDKVLTGLKGTIKKSRPVIFVEFQKASSKNIENLLTPLNYQIYRYDHVRGHFHKNIDQGMGSDRNVFWIPNERSFPTMKEKAS